MRTREFGIRMALGANRRALVRSVTGQALRLTVVGTMLGLAGSIAVTRSLQTLLFDVTPGDPATLGVAVMLFMAAAAAASYVPSRRATRVDPVIALRSE
jgi:putative ABC transport system permease protein